jgi:hypothetical protein
MEIQNAFTKYQHYAFRMETLPVYKVSGEWEDYQSFLKTKELRQNEDLKSFISDIKNTLCNQEKRHIRTRVYPEIMNSYLEFETKIGYIPQAKIGVEFNFISERDFGSLENTYNLQDYWLFDDRYLFLMNYSSTGEFISVEKCRDEKIIKSAIFLKDTSFEKAKTLSFFLTLC